MPTRNSEFVRALTTKEPESVRELVRLVDRDSTNVSMALKPLTELDLVELEDDSRAKTSTVWYDHVEIDIQVTPGETNDSDIARA